MRCVPRTLRAIASSIWMALSVALIPSSGSLAQLPQDKSAPPSKFAEINGVKLHYLVAGKGDPVVLLHGFAETSHMWRPLIAKLSDKHTVIAPDLRGFGQSSAPEGGYTKKAMAQDIHALVREGRRSVPDRARKNGCDQCRGRAGAGPGTLADGGGARSGDSQTGRISQSLKLEKSLATRSLAAICDGRCKYFVHHTTFVDVSSFTHMPALPARHAMRVEFFRDAS